MGNIGKELPGTIEIVPKTIPAPVEPPARTPTPVREPAKPEKVPA